MRCSSEASVTEGQVGGDENKEERQRGRNKETKTKDGRTRDNERSLEYSM